MEGHWLSDDAITEFVTSYFKSHVGSINTRLLNKELHDIIEVEGPQNKLYIKKKLRWVLKKRHVFYTIL